jgi:phosphatidyl-N-methylethanolamine N-methyltransferase
MTAAALVVATLVLSVERACYVLIARAPERFRAWCARPGVAQLGAPVAVVEKLFYAFKGVQVAVFAGWCALHAGGSVWPTSDVPGALAVGLLLIAAGQALSGSVFYRLGRIGAFFGDRLGHAVPWCAAFPFSLMAHPQYVGTVSTIWGVFLVMRFPHADWHLLPAVETVLYAVGAALEEGARGASADGDGDSPAERRRHQIVTRVS